MADPATIIALGTAVGGLASGAAGLMGRKAKTPNMPAMPEIPGPPPPVLSPQGSSTQNPSGGQPGEQPSFLAAAASPAQGNLATKSLLGQ